MNFSDWLKDKVPALLLHFTALFLLNLYLLAVGNRALTLILIDTAWVMTLCLWYGFDFYRRRRYFAAINELMERLDQPYLVQEFLEQTGRLEDQLYETILKRSNKAVIERIRLLEEDQQEYRDFIEGWIHEVKLPITGMRLAAHTADPDLRRRLETSLTTLENDVDQALFFARSDQVCQDYMIRETDLHTVVHSLLARNKHLLIQNQITVTTDCEDAIVFSDAKWLEFILGQILLNAIKYKKETDSQISFYAEPISGGIRLSVRDNGIGIPPEDLSRVFDKGFTGTNGRLRNASTGIGLYLCQKLCRKLGLEIRIASTVQEYTEVSLLFPRSAYLSKL